MREIKLFILKNCPYCVEALRFQEELMAENDAFRQLHVQIVDEAIERTYADEFDYYFVPTYYVGDEKLHEGALTKEVVRRVMDAALLDS